MATTGIFELTEKTTTQSNFPIALVDTTDTTQAAVGSLVKVTLANAFKRRTVTVSDPIIDASQEWNASGVVFTAIKLNVTNTASNTGSLLIDLQVGGVSKMSVDKTGALTVVGALTCGAKVTAANTSSGGFAAKESGGSVISVLWIDGSDRVQLSANSTSLGITAGLYATTVGASGAASNTPAAPVKYWRVRDEDTGTTLKIALYADA